jgi:hypothetical protein
VAGCLLCRPGFISLAVCVGHRVDKVALGQLFSKYFYFLQSDVTLPMSPIQFFHLTSILVHTVREFLKKTHLNPWSMVIKFAIQYVHMNYFLCDIPAARSSSDISAVAHHIQTYMFKIPFTCGTGEIQKLLNI